MPGGHSILAGGGTHAGAANSWYGLFISVPFNDTVATFGLVLLPSGYVALAQSDRKYSAPTSDTRAAPWAACGETIVASPVPCATIIPSEF